MDLYEVRLYNTSGVLLHVFDNWNSLSVENRLNDFSTHTFSFNSNDQRHLSFAKDYFVQVRRRNEFVDWYQEYMGFHRTRRLQTTSTGLELFTSYGRSPEDLLRRRSLAFQPPYLKGGQADNVMQNIVNENTSPAFGRITDGTIFNFSAALASGLGPAWQGDRQGKNLLDVVQEISKASGVDFDVAWVPPNSFRFHTYFPQKGTDRTNRVIFSTDLGNLADVDYTNSATEEFNVVIVDNTFTDSRPSVNDSLWNKSEIMVSANSFNDWDSMADITLAKNAARENISLTVLQTPSCVYGRDYFLGDLVTVRIGSSLFDLKVLGVSLTESGDTHSLKFSFGELEPLPDNLILEAFRNVVRRLKNLEA